MYTGSPSLRLPPPPALLSIPSLLVLETLLNRVLAEPVQAGELEFLQSRRVRIGVTDLSFEFDICFSRQRLCLGRTHGEADLCIRGGCYEYLLLASRKEDADTLFFQRRLQTEGDTELGLEVKNFLDGLDLSDQPLQRLVESGLARLVRTVELFKPRQEKNRL